MSDITEWAEKMLGVKLLPYQARVAEALLRGETVAYARRPGKHYVYEMIEQFHLWSKP